MFFLILCIRYKGGWWKAVFKAVTAKGHDCDA